MRTRIMKEASNEGGLSRRERNKLEKKKRIVEASRSLFKRQGFENTTTQQVAREADIATGTLFLYARTKEDLLVLSFKEEMLETLNQSFDDIPNNARVVESLMVVFSRMIDYHDVDRSLSLKLIREMIGPTGGDRAQDIRELVETIFDRLSRLIILTDARDEFLDDRNAQHMAESAFALYYFGLIGWLTGRHTRPQFVSRLNQQLVALIH